MAGFEVVEDETEEVASALGLQESLAHGKLLAQQKATQQALLFALGQLSKRAVAGISAVFSLVVLASVWALYSQILEEPSQLKLISVGLYSVFVLVLEFIRRKI
jgi:hypothetical protein